MHLSAHLIPLVIVLSSLAFSQPDRLRLSCDVREQDALKSAPPGNRRVHKDTLVVRWQGGVKTMADSGIVEGPFGDVGFRYCGFSPTGFHLLLKQGRDVYGGVLIDHRTGKVLPAGHEVLFSPRRDSYFAVVQVNGMDGQEWRLYSTQGSGLWEGTSNVVLRGAVVGVLEDPHFTEVGELRVTMKCFGANHSSLLTLKRSTTAWRWDPGDTCPAR